MTMPINNGTPLNFVWSRTNYLIFLILKTDDFQLLFLHKIGWAKIDYYLIIIVGGSGRVKDEV